jgi:tryptophanyl-tRNA synthetase
VDKFNRLYSVFASARSTHARRTRIRAGDNVLVRPKALISETSRLPGIDGKAKMSKSLNNAIYLKDSPIAVKEKVMKAYTDPGHIHKESPGKVKGNVVFAYLDAFGPNKKEVAELKKSYTKGGLGDVELKQRLISVLEDFLTPIRKRRYEFEKNKSEIEKILQKGTREGRRRTQKILANVRKAIGIEYF